MEKMARTIYAENSNDRLGIDAGNEENWRSRTADNGGGGTASVIRK